MGNDDMKVMFSEMREMFKSMQQQPQPIHTTIHYHNVNNRNRYVNVEGDMRDSVVGDDSNVNRDHRVNVEGDMRGSAVGDGASVNNLGGAPGAAGGAAPASRPAYATHGTPDFSNYVAIERWFFSQPDNDEEGFRRQVHVIVVALFSGRTLRFVNAVRDKLTEAIFPASQYSDSFKDGVARRSNRRRSSKKTRSSPFKRQYSDLLLQTATYAVAKPQPAAGSSVMVEVVEFIYPEAQELILTLLRSSPDLDDFRRVLTDWLVELCSQENEAIAQMGASESRRVRMQAALALGDLARNDYNHYMSYYFQKWASEAFSQNQTYKATVVAYALSRLAMDPSYTAAVFQQVDQWNRTLSGSLRLSATITCTTLGFVDMKRSLQILKYSLTAKDRRGVTNDAERLLVLILEDHFIRLMAGFTLDYLYKVATHAHIILDTFAMWTREPELDKATKQFHQDLLNYFTSMVQGTLDDDITEYTEAGAETDAPRTPTASTSSNALTIWQLIYQQQLAGVPTPAGSLIYLTKLALQHQKARIVNRMCAIIESWIAQADRNQRLYPLILDVLQMLNADPSGYRHIQRIAHSRRYHNSHTAAMLRHPAYTQQKRTGGKSYGR